LNVTFVTILSKMTIDKLKDGYQYICDNNLIIHIKNYTLTDQDMYERKICCLDEFNVLATDTEENKLLNINIKLDLEGIAQTGSCVDLSEYIFELILYTKETSDKMKLPFEIWNRIFEQCDTFKGKRQLYDSLPESFRIQYPKNFITDGDKCLLKYLSIDDDKEVILTLKIGGYSSSDVQPLLFEEKRLFIKNKQIQSTFRYKHVPKTLHELFDFDKRIYEYYQSILLNNQYKMNKAWKFHYTKMTIEYELKIDNSNICIKTSVIPVPKTK